MSESHVPEGFEPVCPYLTVEGADGLIAFLLEVFEGQEVQRTPMPDGSIAHALVRIAGGCVEINDARPERPTQLGAVHVFVPDVDATFAKAVALGVESIFEPSDSAFGQRIAAFRHVSGTCWYLGCRQTSGA